MNRAYLIIQRVSFDHITHIAHFIHRALVANFGEDAELIICDEIDAVDHDDGAIIFVIGEGFKPHRRRPGCFYVYMNFSIVAVMGNPLRLSKVGWSAIRRKQRMLREKKAGFDVLLDYFAPQTARLKRQLDIPVMGFGVAVDPATLNAPIAPADRPYDVCFVGAVTPRRQRVLAALDDCGLRLSPHNGVVYEDMAAQSRCCINIHAHRSNHLEIPRIIGALATNTPIITEPSYGLEDVFPDDVVTVERCGKMAAAARALCDNLAAEQDQQTRAQEWYEQVYLPMCRTTWADICDNIRALHAASR